MSQPKEVDLALRVLDQQVVDWGGRRCGKVDDIIFEGEPGKSLSLTGIVLGRDSTLPRQPGLFRLLGRLAPTFGDEAEVEVPWSAIAEITHVIKLKEDAQSLGLGRGDRRAEKWLQKVPGA
jgi:hypothetical protein